MVQTQPRSAAEVSRAEAQAREIGAVVVEIYDQVYQLSGIDPVYIETLAATVDGKMRLVAAAGATVDSLRVAVLTALNIADELAQMQQRCTALEAQLREIQLREGNAWPADHPTSSASETASVQSRAGSLMGMLDEVLADRMAS